jgi:replicative DNA helicase
MKQPIFDEWAENAVIGSILLGGTATLDEAREIIREEDFFQSRHREIWKACITLSENKIPFDLLTVGEALKNIPGIDRAYLIQLSNAVPSYESVGYYAKIIKDRALTRLKMHLIERQQKELEEGQDPREVISKGMLEDSRIMESEIKTGIIKIKELATKVYESIEDRIIKNKIIVSKSGFGEYDSFTGGFRAASINVVAGRPGAGKTTWALNVIINQTEPIYIASLEMTANELVEKMIAAAGGVNTKRLENPQIMRNEDWSKLGIATGIISEKPVFIDESLDMKASQIWVRLRRLKSLHDIKLAMVDYLQLVEPERSLSRRDLEVSESLRIFRKMVRDLKIPILLLCQLNRNVEGRKENKPVMSDLKESGSIEQDATTIFFLYQENDYKTNNPDEQIIQGNLAKNRFGPSDVTMDLLFKKSQSKFEDFRKR